MATATDLLILADAYTATTGATETAVSSRIFDDGKKLAAIRRGKDITLRRFNLALAWFSEHWPEGAPWPEGITRASSAANDAAGKMIGAPRAHAGGSSTAPSSPFPAEADA